MDRVAVDLLVGRVQDRVCETLAFGAKLDLVDRILNKIAANYHRVKVAVSVAAQCVLQICG